MTYATVTLNGTQVAEHLGGYLPFSAEITSTLRPRAGNVLAVRLFDSNLQPQRAARPARAGNPIVRDPLAAGRHLP